MSKAIQKVTPIGGDLAQSRPDFATGVEGTQDMRQLRIFPRFKLVTGQSQKLLEKHGVADILIMPEEKVVVEAARLKNGQPDWEKMPGFKVVPLLFYFEWLTVCPFELMGTMPSILYRTLDANDPLVAKCRNSKLRTEPCKNEKGEQITKDGKAMFNRNVENLSWICALREHPLGPMEIATLSFSKGNHFGGVAFANKIQARKAPIFATVFEGKAVFREGRNTPDYAGIDMNNPTDGSGWVTDKGEYEAYMALHKEFKELYDAKRIGTSYDADDDRIPDAIAPDGKPVEF